MWGTHQGVCVGMAGIFPEPPRFMHVLVNVVDSFIHSFIHLFIHSFIHSFTETQICGHSKGPMCATPPWGHRASMRSNYNLLRYCISGLGGDGWGEVNYHVHFFKHRNSLDQRFFFKLKGTQTRIGIFHWRSTGALKMNEFVPF